MVSNEKLKKTEQPDWAPVDAVATLAADEKFFDAIQANERELQRWLGARY
jgi:hypothetical protein